VERVENNNIDGVNAFVMVEATKKLGRQRDMEVPATRGTNVLRKLDSPEDAALVA